MSSIRGRGFSVRALVTLALLASQGAYVRPEVAVASSPQYRYVHRWPQPTWHLNEPRDIAVDKNGFVYVADTENNRIRKYDAAGVLVGGWGSEGTADGRFKKPCGIAADPTGSYVYVADTGNHRVQKFSSTGSFLGKWGKSGGPDFTGTGPGEFNAPEGIAVDGLGDVYVADTNNARIQKFSAAGGFVREWGRPGSDDGQFLLPCGVAVGSDGSIYVVDRDRTNSNVQRFDSSGRFLTKWGAYTLVPKPGLFKSPRGITVDSAGMVYVAEANNLVQVFTASGQYVTGWGTFGPGDNPIGGDGEARSETPMFDNPAGIATFVQGGAMHVLVCDTKNDRVREFSSSGTPLRILGGSGVHPGRFDLPGGVTLSSTGDVLVADTNNHRVQKFSSDGTFQSWTPDSGHYPFGQDRNGYFKSAAGVAVDGAGSVYVVESGNNRVQKLTPELNYVTKWGTTGTGDGFFRKPAGIAVGRVSGSTRVYVADTDNDRIQIFDDSGTYVGKFGTLGSSEGNLNKPSGVAIDTAGHVYVADTANHRVQKFSSGGGFLDQWGSFGSGQGQFKSPAGIGVDSAGAVYVADTDNDRIQKFSPSGEFIASFGTSGPEAGQLDKPRGVVVDRTGRVYVADTGNHRIEVFAPPITINITGVVDQAAYNFAVTPAIQYVGTGIASSGVSLNGKAWTPATISTAGSYVLRAWARDSAGAEVSKEIAFKVDFSAPVSSSDATATYADKAQIAIKAVDDISGVDKTYAQVDDGPETVTKAIVVTSFGPHTLKFWSLDKAGNLEAKKTVRFDIKDMKPPVTTSDTRQEYAEMATIHLKAADAQSPIAHTYYSVDEAVSVEGTTVAVSGYGAHSLEYYSVDTAGNTELSHTEMFTILKGAKLSLTRTPSALTYPGTVTLKATLKNLSGQALLGKKVTLWRSTNGVSFSRYKTLSSSTGTYAFSEKPSSNVWYRMTSASDSTYASASSSIVSAKVRARLGSPGAPTLMRKYKSYSITGSIRPSHRATVTLKWERKEKGRWILKTSTRATCAAGSTTYRGSAAMKLSGSWRVRAYHSDAGHAASYSGYRYTTVR